MIIQDLGIIPFSYGFDALIFFGGYLN